LSNLVPSNLYSYYIAVLYVWYVSMNKKNSNPNSKSPTISDSPIPPQFKSSLFQGSTPIQNVKKANQSPKTPTQERHSSSSSVNVPATASQQEIATVPTKPDKAKSLTSFVDPPTIPILKQTQDIIYSAVSPSIANIQETTPLRIATTLESSPFLPTRQVVQSNIHIRENETKNNIRSITRYFIVILLSAIVLASRKKILLKKLTF
jgi:hypothetical protein